VSAFRPSNVLALEKSIVWSSAQSTLECDYEVSFHKDRGTKDELNVQFSFVAGAGT